MKQRNNQSGKVSIILIILVLLLVIGLTYYYQSNGNLGLNFLNIDSQNNEEAVTSLEVPATEFYAPILMYHHIADQEEQNSYYVSPEIFTQQMQWLKDNGYTVISLDDFYRRATSSQELPDKPVVITFDDGVIDQYTQALPILKDFGNTATFFIKLNNVGEGKGGMTWDMIRELVNSGMTIGSHSINHDNMTSMDAKTLTTELEDSKTQLEENLGIVVNYFSYPGGACSAETIAATEEAGYKLAVTTSHQVEHVIEDLNSLYQIGRIHIDNEMGTFINWVQGKNLK